MWKGLEITGNYISREGDNDTQYNKLNKTNPLVYKTTTSLIHVDTRFMCKYICPVLSIIHKRERVHMYQNGHFK